MSSQEDEGQKFALGLVFILIALVVAFAIGVGIKTTRNAAAAKAAVTAAPAAGADEASVQVVDGVVKFYFASAKADLAAGGNEALATIVQAAAAGKSVAVSGFHDATGDAEKNAELAKLRAFAVRDALKALGVAEDKIELRKPEQTLATGTDAQARRVEVSVK